MASRQSSSCTQKRVTSASSSALGATPATQVSGETFLSLSTKRKDPCTVKNMYILLVDPSLHTFLREQADHLTDLSQKLRLFIVFLTLTAVEIFSSTEP